MARQTLNYSEKIDAFQSFTGLESDGFVSFNGKLFSVVGGKIYSVTPEQKRYSMDGFFIRLIVNEDYQYTKVFDNVEYYTDGILLTDAVYRTTNQDSTHSDESDVEKRESTNKLSILRAQNEDRLRGKFLISDYLFRNKNNTKAFTVPYIKTRYRYSMI